ncbi:hypothetical protein [Dyadobacter sp. LHD-138]|uniref:hypothetical protein n=1 Tax=Dyadobacter sp. LHD-138 TaxID=3071413 RepID=UPI0027DF5C01|nr:hypothetical protein [Dyadobacter sp. LHD-138]MDQ6480567.1 hypothetical protein [Dyadobacter sp. LHD-138]
MVVAIIDSHPVFLSGLTQFLYEFFPKAQVIRSVSLNAFDENRVELKPDLLILGVNSFFKVGELKTLEAIKESMPSAYIVVLYDEIHMAIPLLKIGARGFLAKRESSIELLDCLQCILKGKRYLNEEVFEWIVRPTS